MSRDEVFEAGEKVVNFLNLLQCPLAHEEIFLSLWAEDYGSNERCDQLLASYAALTLRNHFAKWKQTPPVFTPLNGQPLGNLAAWASQNVSLDLYRRSRALGRSILQGAEQYRAGRSSLKDCAAYIALFIVCVWDFIVSGDPEDLIGVLGVTVWVDDITNGDRFFPPSDCHSWVFHFLENKPMPLPHGLPSPLGTPPATPDTPAIHGLPIYPPPVMEDMLAFHELPRNTPPFMEGMPAVHGLPLSPRPGTSDLAGVHGLPLWPRLESP